MYDALGLMTELLRRIARAMGSGISQAALWAAIVGASTKTAASVAPLIGNAGARHVRQRLDGSKELIGAPSGGCAR
jgi:hypothetical protein